MFDRVLSEEELERIEWVAREEVECDDLMMVREGPYPFEPDDVLALVAEVRRLRAEAAAPSGHGAGAMRDLAAVSAGLCGAMLRDGVCRLPYGHA